MNRPELADAVNAELDRANHDRRKIDHLYVDYRWIGKLERGETRWPHEKRRAALRHVLHATTDDDLGLYSPRITSEDHTHPNPAESARRRPEAGSPESMAEESFAALGAGGEADAGWRGGATRDAADASELALKVRASDVTAALPGVEAAVDELAIAYATTPPGRLLPRARRHLRYVGELLGKRMTLDEHQRLLVAGGWLSLIAATLRIDLRHRPAAVADLATAQDLAQQVGHREIDAWCWETRAWDALTRGDYAGAVGLSLRAQAAAPKGSSALVQATAQEGRAWARMGRGEETRTALGRVERLVSPRPRPERPEHHYQYDPAKALSYTATTLAWVGDSGAEGYARTAITELEAANDGVVRPRRIASARLDLGLALLAAKKPDEAADNALKAITSGRVVGSNWWRATEILHKVEATGITEAAELRDAWQTFTPR